MHFLGLAGMPRRIADYPGCFCRLELWSPSIGAYISYASTLFFVFIVLHTLFAGRRVGPITGARGDDARVEASLAAAVPQL